MGDPVDPMTPETRARDADASPAEGTVAGAAAGTVAGAAAGTVAKTAPEACGAERDRKAGAVRLVIDAVLVALALLQMVHAQLPDALHEACGILLAMAVAAHAVQHRSFWGRLRSGRWDARRVVVTAVIVIPIGCLVAMVASGLVMSGIAVNLGVAVGTGTARAVHLPLVHLGFCLVALHVGTQWGKVLAMASAAMGRAAKAARAAQAARVARVDRAAWTSWALRAVVLAIACWGVFNLVELQFADYILGTVGFAFIDPAKPVMLGVAQYASVFVLFAAVGHVLAQILRRRTRQGV